MDKKKTVKKVSSNSAKSKSWRDLPQKSAKRALTPQAKVRKRIGMLKLSFTVTGIIAMLALLTSVFYLHTKKPSLFTVGGPSQPIKDIKFRTDGVLTKEWLHKKINFKKNVSLMDLDIKELAHILQAEPQVSQARVRRAFPETLLVEIQESRPIMKIRIAGADNKPIDYIVGNDGSIYENKSFPKIALSGLPYLSGLSLKSKNGDFEQVAEVAEIALLLDKAREQYPHIYSTWSLVSCEDYDVNSDDAWSVLKVFTNWKCQIVFKPTEFDEQLARLQSILQRVNNGHNLSMIDLTMTERAAVRIANNTL